MRGKVLFLTIFMFLISLISRLVSQVRQEDFHETFYNKPGFDIDEDEHF